jgi:hypothetical protein
MPDPQDAIGRALDQLKSLVSKSTSADTGLKAAGIAHDVLSQVQAFVIRLDARVTELEKQLKEKQ